MDGRCCRLSCERKSKMTKHEALKDLEAVLRRAPAHLPPVEAGPAPLTPAKRFAYANSVSAGPGVASSLLSHLLPSFGGTGGAGSGSSLLDSLLGATGSPGSKNSGLGLAGGLSPLLSGLFRPVS